MIGERRDNAWAQYNGMTGVGKRCLTRSRLSAAAALASGL